VRGGSGPFLGHPANFSSVERLRAAIRVADGCHNFPTL
jgi:hypothetical protein